MNKESMTPNAIRRNRQKQSGYTLLEYAAGAALLMGVLYVGLRAMGGSLENLLRSIGTFADQRSTELTGKTSS